jgi:hypothetical protein
MRRLLIVVFAGCGGSTEGNLVASTSFVLGERSGQGPSALDVLYGQQVALEVELAAAMLGHETSQGCRHTVSRSEMAIASATGAQASVVEAELLAKLPAWDLRLALCEPASDSALSLRAELDGLAVTVGCVPPSAQLRDEADDPRFSNFTASDCDGSVYDYYHDRLFQAHAFTLTVTHRSE